MRPRHPLSSLLALSLVLGGLPALAACSGLTVEELPPIQGQPPRTLFFALDSVPFGIVAELADPARGEEALFAGFSQPVPLISSFPSTSSVAFTGILEPFGLPKPPGYEARFFDRHRNEVRGGGLISYYRIPFAWRDFLTWRYGEPIRRALATATPAKSAVGEVLWVLRQFARSEEPSFHGYVAMTDGTAHLEGPEGLIAALRTLDAGIRKLRHDNPDRPFNAVIYSDHGIAGGESLVNVRKQVQQALRSDGYRLRRKIRGSDDAVMVPFGLVSSFEIYADGGEGLDVAATAAQVKGVDLCVARLPEGAGCWVASSRGDAIVEHRTGPSGELWSYRPQTGDPLDYIPVVERLRQRAGDPQAVWFPDTWWLEATHDHFYPDALHRMVRTFDLVQNTASAVCSLAPGYMYGAGTTELAARLSKGRLRWTHGALFDESSLGFFVTDVPGWEAPSAVRFDEALIPFAEPSEPARAMNPLPPSH